MKIEDFSYAFINDDVEFVEIYHVDKFPFYKAVKEIYKHNNVFYMITYHQYPNESLETIILDREYELNLVIKKTEMREITDWEIVE